MPCENIVVVQGEFLIPSDSLLKGKSSTACPSKGEIPLNDLTWQTGRNQSVLIVHEGRGNISILFCKWITPSNIRPRSTRLCRAYSHTKVLTSQNPYNTMADT